MRCWIEDDPARAIAFCYRRTVYPADIANHNEWARKEWMRHFACIRQMLWSSSPVIFFDTIALPFRGVRGRVVRRDAGARTTGTGTRALGAYSGDEAFLPTGHIDLDSESCVTARSDGPDAWLRGQLFRGTYSPHQV